MLRPWETNTSSVHTQSWKIAYHMHRALSRHSSSTASILQGRTSVPEALKPRSWISNQFPTRELQIAWEAWERPPACFLQVGWIFLEVAMAGKAKCCAPHNQLIFSGFYASLLLWGIAEKEHFVADWTLLLLSGLAASGSIGCKTGNHASPRTPRVTYHIPGTVLSQGPLQLPLQRFSLAPSSCKQGSLTPAAFLEESPPIKTLFTDSGRTGG